MLLNRCFLWVVQVVDTILAKHDEGSSLITSLTHMDQMPSKLRELYIQIIQELPTADKAVTNKMLLWLPGQPDLFELPSGITCWV